jgi:LuxR family maltose regulon positive regulatory protein
VAGELVELRASDLRLTLDEASRVVAAGIDQPVEDKVIAGLHQRMGGWMAGLRLAVSAAARADDPEVELERIWGAGQSWLTCWRKKC